LTEPPRYKTDFQGAGLLGSKQALHFIDDDDRRIPAVQILCAALVVG
jgi:hypothetical protein